ELRVVRAVEDHDLVAAAARRTGGPGRRRLVGERREEAEHLRLERARLERGDELEAPHEGPRLDARLLAQVLRLRADLARAAGSVDPLDERLPVLVHLDAPARRDGGRERVELLERGLAGLLALLGELLLEGRLGRRVRLRPELLELRRARGPGLRRGLLDAGE